MWQEQYILFHALEFKTTTCKPKVKDVSSTFETLLLEKKKKKKCTELV